MKFDPTVLRSAVDELKQFVSTDSSVGRFFGTPAKHADAQKALGRFLESTMDQVRVNRALECTLKILKVSDLDDFEMFREGVWKREATGAINFQGQRDHTAHTLNNWLLGWYFYSNSPPISMALNEAIARRKWREQKISAEQFFGHVWLFTSLLHDIGYLFEGSLSLMETSFQSAQAVIGLRVADEYFISAFGDTPGSAQPTIER